MLLAGDIGVTTTRLALVSADAGPRKFVSEQEFRSADFKGLQPIVQAFPASSGEWPSSACLDVAGLVIAGHAHLTNLSWDLEEAALCRDLDLHHITLLNDLEAIAHAVPHLQPGETAKAQGYLNEAGKSPHAAITSPRRRSHQGRYGRTEWPCETATGICPRSLQAEPSGELWPTQVRRLPARRDCRQHDTGAMHNPGLMSGD